MGFGTAIATCFRKYATFQGRARRSEYWYFQLFLFLAEIVLNIVIIATRTAAAPETSSGAADSPILGVLLIVFILGTFLPSLAVLVRRLHDTDRSGWWYFIILVPIVGFILLIVWFCTKGTNGPNRYGQDPTAEGVAAVFS